MAIDSGSYSINTGPPQYTAASYDIYLEEILPKNGGMEVVIRAVATTDNGRGFNSNAEFIVSAGGTTKSKEEGLFSPSTEGESSEYTVTFTFDRRTSVEVLVDSGTNVDNVTLSAPKPKFPDIKGPMLNVSTQPGKVLAGYTLTNEGDAQGDASVDITMTLDGSEVFTDTFEHTIPSGKEIVNEITAELDISSESQVEVCAE